MVVARVILKGAKSYRLGGRRFIKDVPQVIKGDEVTQYLENGFFHVAMLKGEVAKPVPSSSKREVVETDEDDDVDEEPELPVSKKAAPPKTMAQIASKKNLGAGLKKRT